MKKVRTTGRKLIGVISDTHGLLRPEVAEVFTGVNLIIHAGDIGTADVIEELKSIAPVIAVRGNNDKGSWASAIPETEVAEIGGVRAYILHDLKEIGVSPAASRFQVVISGHSHRPLIETRDEVLFLNPGSAGPRRFKLPVSVARLTIEGSVVNAKIIELTQRGGPDANKGNSRGSV
ncbi:MAG TPA: metallophosphoesterase family protein [Terriglobia bacterium]|nr:metallophosphoesterase family protein [Terriglobia bacterium]